MEKFDDDEALLEEARELIAAANYPDDLNRYFDVLRKRGFEMNVAGTYIDLSERWEFSKVSGQKKTYVTITLSRDRRSLDCVTTLDLPSGESQKSAGQSVEQLETQLNEWA